MGSGGSSYKGEMKEVVVIGGGHAGFACAKQLAETQSDITITVISDKEYLDFNFGSPRGIVDPESTTERCFPLKEALAFVSKDIKFKCAQVESVTKTEVIVKNCEERIPFDAAVLCTGASYGEMPWKAPVGEKKWQDWVENVKGWHNKAEAAKHIVVAGAGIVGVEVAAELGAKYKDTDKKITLVGTFLRQTPSLAGHCSSVLESYGVHLMPGRTGDWHEGDKKVKIGDKEIECDLLLPCTGLKFNSGMMDEHFTDAVSKTNKRVHCKDTLAVDHPGAANIFACGDIVAIPQGKSPSAAPAQTIEEMAPVVASNVLAVLSAKSCEAKFEFPSEVTERPCMIALGPEKGGGLLPCAMCCYGCCGGCGTGCLGNCMTVSFKSGDGFVGFKSAGFGKGGTWTDEYFCETPGQSKEVQETQPKNQK